MTSDKKVDDVARNCSSPPDGGWGWCVVLASFFSNFLQGGFIFTTGILYRDVSDYFRANRQTIGTIASVTLTVAYGTAIINGPIVCKFGSRPVGVAGGLLCSAGLLLTTFASSVEYLYFSCGFLAAWGVGLMFMPGIVIVQEYFYRRRALAAGLSLCGAGVGAFAFAPLLTLLQEEYGWRGTFVILGGFMLNGCACALVYRPLMGRSAIISVTAVEQEDSVAKSHLEEGSAKEMRPVEQLQPNVSPELSHKAIPSSGTLSLQNEAPYEGQQLDVRNQERERGNERRGRLGNEPKLFRNCRSDERGSVETQRLASVRDLAACLCLNQRFPILTKASVLILALGAVIAGMGLPTVLAFLPDLAVKEGISKSDAAILVSVIGVAMTGGRVVLGWVSDKPCVNKILSFSVTIITVGVATALCPFCLEQYGLLACNVAVYGAGYGYRVSLIPVVVSDLVGLELMATGSGLVFFGSSAGALIGTPLAGLVFDRTGSYTLSFVLAGILLMLGGSLSFLVFLTPEYTKSRTTERGVTSS